MSKLRKKREVMGWLLIGLLANAKKEADFTRYTRPFKSAKKLQRCFCGIDNYAFTEKRRFHYLTGTKQNFLKCLHVLDAAGIKDKHWNLSIFPVETD